MTTDTDRLDFLDRVNANTNRRCGTTYGWKYDINHNRAALTDSNLPALTVREAIDAAMTGKETSMPDLFDVTCGDLKMLDLRSRQPLYLQVSRIAGVRALRCGGSRILFCAGGSVDVCGTLDEWRLQIALANAKLDVSRKET
jgi:hypothetical protein